MDDLLQEGVMAFNEGRREEASRKFSAFVTQSPESETGWGWMYNVCNTDQERIHCLKQVVRINPNNVKANQILHTLMGLDFPLDLPQSSPAFSQLPPSFQTPKSVVNPSGVQTNPKNLDNISILLIVILVLLSMFWMGIGLVQLISLPIIGLWNIFISIINLALIRGIIKRTKNLLNELYFLSVLGTIGGVIQMLAMSAYLQACVIPLYGALGVLAYLNQDLYKSVPPQSTPVAIKSENTIDIGSILFYIVVVFLLVVLGGVVLFAIFIN